MNYTLRFNKLILHTKYKLVLKYREHSYIFSRPISVTFLIYIYKKNLVRHSHNFLLPYNTVEEYFIINITIIFNFYFLYFVVDELAAFVVIVDIF